MSKNLFLFGHKSKGYLISKKKTQYRLDKSLERPMKCGGKKRKSSSKLTYVEIFIPLELRSYINTT